MESRNIDKYKHFLYFFIMELTAPLFYMRNSEGVLFIISTHLRVDMCEIVSDNVNNSTRCASLRCGPERVFSFISRFKTQESAS